MERKKKGKNDEKIYQSQIVFDLKLALQINSD